MEFVVVDAETMQKTEKKKNLKQTTGVHDEFESRRLRGTRTKIPGAVPTKIRGVPKQIMEVLKQFDIHGERRPDPWVITDADQRPVTTTHNEPIDEAREPAREYHASLEVSMGVGSWGNPGGST